MTRSRWTVLVLVLAALGLSLAYGLKPGEHKVQTSASLVELQQAAALAPCPTGLGSGFPKLSLACLGGGPYVDVDHATPGVPMLVNVYGSWCGPCQKEMPLLRDFYEQTRGKVALVGVDTEEIDATHGLEFAKDVRQHWPTVYDPERKIGAHFVKGVPITVFVDAAGKVVHVEPNPFADVAQIKALTKRYLGVTV